MGAFDPRLEADDLRLSACRGIGLGTYGGLGLGGAGILLAGCPALAQAAESPGAQFPLCGLEHGTILALTIGLSGGLVLVLRMAQRAGCECRVRRIVCFGLATLLAAELVTEQAERLAGGYWTVRDALPLHLCDLAAVVLLAALLAAGLQRASPALPGSLSRGTQQVYELSYFWGLGGTSQALLTPDLHSRFPEWDCVRFFGQHMLIVIGVAALTFGLGLRPRRGALWRVWWVTLAAALVALGANALTGGNYMYLGEKPAQATLLDLLGPYPYSLLGLAAVATGLLALLYLPYYLYDRRREQAGGSRRAGGG